MDSDLKKEEEKKALEAEKRKKTEKERLLAGCGSVLQGMAGKNVAVELRGDNYVIGELVDCDSDLNIQLKNVTVIRDSQETKEPVYYVTGKFIRFVHFKDQVNVQAAIKRCARGDRAVNGNRRADQKQFDTGKKLVDQ
ncbi:Protein CBG03715 [Caenorhabditis briggsae]|uniref:Protein CBG03715 n=1 Tax=Caenorhabditis briggsae TaxID=6238 RepID=A8WWJ1_CAEBR|nr:Protein CBG03715 [Caenorhabditis briggsae]CAP24563.1 Protein CBG03715 [Caenorhabditis briggsae]